MVAVEVFAEAGVSVAVGETLTAGGSAFSDLFRSYDVPFALGRSSCCCYHHRRSDPAELSAVSA